MKLYVYMQDETDDTFVRDAPWTDAEMHDMNVWLVGEDELVGQFYDAGLLDELIVQVGSVTLGSGKPLLPRRITSPSLILESVRAIGPGFAELRYRVPRG